MRGKHKPTLGSQPLLETRELDDTVRKPTSPPQLPTISIKGEAPMPEEKLSLQDELLRSLALTLVTGPVSGTTDEGEFVPTEEEPPMRDRWYILVGAAPIKYLTTDGTKTTDRDLAAVYSEAETYAPVTAYGRAAVAVPEVIPVNRLHQAYRFGVMRGPITRG